jgi:hypothetical protein
MDSMLAVLSRRAAEERTFDGDDTPGDLVVDARVEDVLRCLLELDELGGGALALD